MDFQKSLSQAFEVVKLKEPAMQTLAKDPKALEPALIITALGAVLGGLGTYFFPYQMMGVSYQPDVPGLIVSILTVALITLLGLFLTGYLAEKVFHSKLSMHGYVKVMGHANILSFFSIYPLLSILSAVWTFVVFCFVLSKLGKLGVGSIILLILLGLLIFGVMGSVVGIATTGGMMGGGYSRMMGY